MISIPKVNSKSTRIYKRFDKNLQNEAYTEDFSYLLEWIIQSADNMQSSNKHFYISNSLYLL